ncbi:uracil-DNA glycosylase [Microvirga arabica]|uniref:uracil-DNA glycosylase n=1 Tax=Microvirga arabica TaxID=1128671 RepID=UPI00360C9C58
MTGPISQALDEFRAKPGAEGWLRLPFFQDGSAEAVTAKVDAAIASGAQVLPPPDAVFTSISLTPLEKVKVMVLVRTPTPRRAIPTGSPSPIAAPGGCPPRCGQSCARWRRIWTCRCPHRRPLEMGPAGRAAHQYGSDGGGREIGSPHEIGLVGLVDQAITAISQQQPAVVFLLWGGPARKRAALVDRTKHLVIEAGHPSPLNRLNDFRGTKPFSQANAWLVEKGLEPIDWRLDT